MIKFIIIGAGWRADFFQRIASQIPGEFHITAIVVRSEERIVEQTKRGFFTTMHLEKALATKPDFAVLSIAREGVVEYLDRLMDAQIPVLCETPPGSSIEELDELYALAMRKNGRIQVAEQCFLRPIYQAWLQVIEEGRIGTTSHMRVSTTQGYHAISLMRKFLQVGYETCKITAQRFQSPVAQTRGRQGHNREGSIVMSNRVVATFAFESGKVGFYDFSEEQHFSPIRQRSIQIRGEYGEINDNRITYLEQKEANEQYPNGCYMPISGELIRISDGIYNIDGFSLEALMLGNERVYENEYYGARLNDDELAMARCMRLMKQYVESGVDVYSLNDALHDTYLSFLLEEAISTGTCITSGVRDYHK